MRNLVERGGDARVEVVVTPAADAEPMRSEVAWRVEVGDTRRVAMELGELRVHLGSGAGLAVRGARVHEWSVEGEPTWAGLTAVVPEVPAVGLRFALGGELEGVEWLLLTTRENGADHVIGRRGDDLIGIESRGGVIERAVWQFEGETPWTIEARRLGLSGLSVEMPDTAGVERVGSVAALTEQRGVFVAGRPMPDLGLVGLDGRAWSPASACRSELGWMAVVIARPADEREAMVIAERLVEADASACVTLVAAIEFDEFDDDARRAVVRRWAGLSREGVSVAWMVDDASRDQPATVVIRPGGEVAGVRIGGAETLDARAWISELGPARGE